MNKIRFGVIALSCVIALGCARQEDPADQAAMAAAAGDASVAAEPRPPAVIPKATIAPVNVRITLSPAAKARLESAKEEISIAAVYAGDPMESTMGQAGPSGMIDLGKNTQLLPGEGSVVFEEDVIDPKRLALTEGEVQLTINVTTAKKSGTENFLACPFYWDTLEAAGKETVEINCKLTSEVTSN